MTQKQNSTLPAIIVCILLFGMISFVTNLASPMGDVLKYSLGRQGVEIPNLMATLGVFCNFIAYAVMGIPGGNLLSKHGYKKTALLAVLIGFTGVGIQAIAGLLGGLTSFGVYLLGAFVAGFSMCLLNLVVNPMLNKLGGGGNRGNQLVQVGGSFNSLMGTAVIFLSGFFVPNVLSAEIKQVFPLMGIALAIFAVSFVVILLTKIPENPNVGKKAVGEKSQYGPMSFRHFVFGAVAIFIYVGVEVGVPNVLQKWLNYDLSKIEEVTLPEGGVVKTINVVAGSEVKNGDELATIAVKEVVDGQEVETVKPLILNLPGLKKDQKVVVSAIGNTEKKNCEMKEVSKTKVGSEIKPGGVVLEVDTASASPIASSVTAMYWLLMLVGRLLGAALGAKISAKSMLTAVSTLGLVLVVGAIFLNPVMVNLPVFKGAAGFGMALVPVNALLLVLCGLCTSVMWGGIFNLAVEGLGKYTERGAGIFMAMVCGGGILPLLQNGVVDWAGSFQVSYWVIVAGLAFLLYYALVGSKNVNKNIPTE